MNSAEMNFSDAVIPDDDQDQDHDPIPYEYDPAEAARLKAKTEEIKNQKIYIAALEDALCELDERGVEE